MSAVPEPTSRKRLVVGCRVSGSFGELIPNPDPNKKRCVCKRLVGNVLHAVGHGKYMVAFDNGETLECCSNRLRVERSSSSIPPDNPPQQAIARPSNAPPRAPELVAQEESDVIEATEDTHEDEEHIPPPADEDEDDGDPSNDTEEGQGEADQGQGGVEEQQPNDPEG